MYTIRIVHNTQATLWHSNSLLWFSPFCLLIHIFLKGVLFASSLLVDIPSDPSYQSIAKLRLLSRRISYFSVPNSIAYVLAHFKLVDVR